MGKCVDFLKANKEKVQNEIYLNSLRGESDVNYLLCLGKYHEVGYAVEKIHGKTGGDLVEISKGELIEIINVLEDVKRKADEEDDDLTYYQAREGINCLELIYELFNFEDNSLLFSFG